MFRNNINIYYEFPPIIKFNIKKRFNKVVEKFSVDVDKFDYKVKDPITSESEFDFIKPGSRVSVPFGKSRIITGIVSNIHNEMPLSYDVKPIHQIIDETPIVNQNQLSFWDWMSNYYMCGIGEVMKASIPSVLLIESETIISLNKKTEFNHNELSDDEILIYEA